MDRFSYPWRKPHLTFWRPPGAAKGHWYCRGTVDGNRLCGKARSPRAAYNDFLNKVKWYGRGQPRYPRGGMQHGW